MAATEPAAGGSGGRRDYYGPDWRVRCGCYRTRRWRASILDEYVDELFDRRGHPETTVLPIRSRLRKYAHLYVDVNETADLLTPLLEERLLVVGLAGWGLRSSELCALRAEQVVLGRENGEYPYLEFGEGEHKNGSRTVALLVGIDELGVRIDALSEDTRWSDYLFPSTAAASGHPVTDTARNRFTTLAKRADVIVASETPTSKMGRRFWYSIYGVAVRRIAERCTPIAEDQRSADPGVVLDNYLSEAERRKHRREALHDELTGLFEGMA